MKGKISDHGLARVINGFALLFLDYPSPDLREKVPIFTIG
jgi:hypothetical protein